MSELYELSVSRLIKASPETVLVLDADCQVTASIADAVDKFLYEGTPPADGKRC